MNRLSLFIRRYTDNRAIVALLSLMAVLEIVFILRIIKPDIFRVVLDNHIFELVVLLALAQMILLNFRMLDRVPGKVAADEHESEVLLRDVLRNDNRAKSLHVFSCGLSSRFDMLTSIHNETKGTLRVEVLAQAVAKSIDTQDAQRMRALLEIWKRDHSEAPVEIRFFETPATFRALILCDRQRKPFWGVMSWYRYEKFNNEFRVIGRRNPGVVLRGLESAQDQIMLNFLMETFEKQWKDWADNKLVVESGK